jgi:hypothetical protein
VAESEAGPSPAQTTTQLALPENSANSLFQEIQTYRLSDESLWAIFFATLYTGGFGGFIYFLINFRKIRKNLDKEVQETRSLPSTPQWEEKLGRFQGTSRLVLCAASHVLTGAAAAPPVVLLLQPGSTFALLALSIASGLVGSAAFRNLQERILASLDTVDAAEADRREAQERQKALLETLFQYNTLQAKTVAKLMQIAQTQSGDEHNWQDVQAIAEQLARIAQASSISLIDPFTAADRSDTDKQPQGNPAALSLANGIQDDFQDDRLESMLSEILSDEQHDNRPQ